MYTLLKSKFLLVLWPLWAAIVFEYHFESSPLSSDINCSTGDCVYSSNPVMVIIGEDLSISFNKSSHIQTQNIEEICRAVAKSGRGGQIIVGAVGNQDPKGYISCDLNPLPKPPAKGAIGDHARCKSLARKVEQENESTIQSFLGQCGNLLKNRNHKITDISGFLNKAKILSEQPGASKFEIWLYINSDGEQDIKTGVKETVDCSKKPDPKKVKFYVSSWPGTAPNCSAKGVFLDPSQFVNFFKTQI